VDELQAKLLEESKIEMDEQCLAVREMIFQSCYKTDRQVTTAACHLGLQVMHITQTNQPHA